MRLRRTVEFDTGEIHISVRRRQGVLRLSSPRLFSSATASHATNLAACALELSPVIAVRSSLKRGWLEIDYRPDVVDAGDLLRRLSQALRAKMVDVFDSLPAGVNGQVVQRIIRGESGVVVMPDLEVEQGWKRVVYRILAVSSLGMTILAFLVPAIPTPPFLATTMYFSIRSSPALKRWLEQSWMFGRMIADWREHRGVRPIVKIKSLLISYAILGLCVVLFDVTGVTLYVVLAVAAINTLIILLLPTLPASIAHAEPPAPGALRSSDLLVQALPRGA
jgi:uncharacterized protein